MNVQTEWDMDHLSNVGPKRLPDDVFIIIGYLHKHCRGPENAVTSAELAAFLGLEGSDPGRHIRHLIELHLDQFPFVVCGRPGKGFFVTEDPDDMTRYEATLHSILIAAASKIGAFRRLTNRVGYTNTGNSHRPLYARKETAGRVN